MSRKVKHTARTVIVAAAVGATALVAVPGPATAAKVKFGSKLTSQVQPSNANTAHYCDENDTSVKCTWTMNEAYGRPDGGEKSPKTGTLRKLKLIAGEAGKFKLQIVKAKEVNGKWRTKLVRNGPTIRYEGQEQEDPQDYKVEVFKVNVPIKKGQRLGIKTKSTSTLRCSSGGDNTLISIPPLVLGKGFAPIADGEGCWLLLEGVVKY